VKRVRDKGNYYLVLYGVDEFDESKLDDCFKSLCTNKKALAEITGISRYKLTRLLTRKGRSYIRIGDTVIFKTSNLYKGSNPGGLRNLNLIRLKK